MGIVGYGGYSPYLIQSDSLQEDAQGYKYGNRVVFLSLSLLAMFTVFLTFPVMDWLFVIGVVGSAALNVGTHLASTCALQLEDASLVMPLLWFSAWLYRHHISCLSG